jgi:glycosyltransferase involved in cell wall biosynthesis
LDSKCQQYAHNIALQNYDNWQICLTVSTFAVLRYSGWNADKNSNFMRSIWITWSAHRRTTGLCDAWDIPLHVLRPKHSGPIRWIGLSLRTLRLLRRSRPDVLFVQNPSLALTVLAVSIRPLFGYRLVVDAHNEGIRPFDRPYAIVRFLTRHLLKSADITIVTNDALSEDVDAAGGHPLALPDRLPVVPELAEEPGIPGDPPDVVVVATFRPDEPIAAIMAAAATMPGISFAVTGPAERYHETSAPLPPNVRLTGFLPDLAYWQLLAGAGVICDLTMKPDCLVCGAYEALAVGKPMVLSDNPPTRDIFASAAVLTGCEAEDIASAIGKAVESRQQLASSAQALRGVYPGRWKVQADAVWNAIKAKTLSGRRLAE